MAAVTTKKRAADNAIGSLAKKFRLVAEDHDTPSIATSPADSPPETVIDAHSDIRSTPKTDITTPELLKDEKPRDTYICPYKECGKTFDRPSRLAIHVRSHTQERPFVCPELGCNKAFTREEHRKRHVATTHTDVGKYACEWKGCDKTFSTPQRVRTHQKVHENAERYKCNGFPPCEQSFRKHKTLEAHRKLVHLNEDPFPCNLTDPSTGERCLATYKISGKLESHQLRVHGGERYFCTLCETSSELHDNDAMSSTTMAGFNTYNALQTHIREVHPPRCHECNLVFVSTKKLRAHVDIVHEVNPVDEQRKFVCPTCEKAFTKKGNLDVHINNVHNNARNFTCATFDPTKSKSDELAAWNPADACDGTFKTKQQLENHIRVEHLGLDSEWSRKRKRRLANGDISVRKAGGFFPRPDAKNIDPIMELTGFGYDEHREIACLHPRCDRRFNLEQHLRRHCQTVHEMPNDQITELIAEREALSGGQFWVGGVEPGVGDPFEEWTPDANMPQGAGLGMDRVREYIQGYDSD